MKRILVIDDSEANLLLINSIFEDDPEIEVALENNSTRALKTVRKQNPDLILLDLMMPNIDGFQILGEMRKDSFLDKIPVMIVSARLDSEAKKEAKKYRVSDYIEKPLDLDLIEKKIYQILNIRPVA
ncbi:MAG: response regulator [Chloroflexia bacterium]|nr:response regulator [Chloroflexia bacterium]